MRTLMNMLSFLPSFHPYPARDIPEGVKFKIAESTEERELALRLLQQGGDQRSAQEEYYLSKWSHLPCTTTLICKKDDVILGAVTLIHDDGFGLPCEKYHNLGRVRQKGGRLMEISGIAVKKKDLFLPLFRYAFEYAHRLIKADGLIISTSEEFSQVYRNLFRFRLLESGKLLKPDHDPSKDKITQILFFHGLEAEYLSRYGKLSEEKNYHRYFFSKRFFEFQLPKRKFQLSSGPLLTAEQFKHFFEGRSVLERLTEKERFSLADAYDFAGLRDRILGDRRPSYHRSSPRIPVRYKASIVNANADRIRYGEIQQIAMSGLLLSIPNMDFSIGEEISVTLDVEKRGRIKVKGHVVWAGNNGAGVMLEEAPQSWKDINEYAWSELGMIAKGQELRAA